MEILKRNLELVEIKSLEEIYHLTSTLFGKRKELSPILQESNQDSFIKKITPYVKSECIDCTDLIAHDEQESEIGDKVKKLYDFLNEFNDIFGESSTHKLLKKVGFIESHIKATIDSLKSVTHFRSHLNLEELSQWDNKNFIQSVGAHKEVSEKQTELADDFFKPLVSYFLNDLSKDKKAEFLLKLDLFKKSGWAEYILKEGSKDESPDIVRLFHLFEESRKTNKMLDYKKQQEFKNTFERFFESIELGIIVNQKGLNIATMNNKNMGLYNLATAGMPDGAVKGCPHMNKGEVLYVGWATANTKKYAQNLQWFRHLEGIDFSIKMKRKGFENFKKVDASIVSLAINHDDETIGFIESELKEEEKKAFQILGETTEICKGISVQNGRFKALADKISSVALIGSKTEMSLLGKTDKDINNELLSIVKNVNNSLKVNLEKEALTNNNKVKREIYLTDFCNAVSYLSETNKQNIEFKEFLKSEVSPTFIGLAKVYPEMSNHLMKTLSFSLMNADGIVFDILNQIESNANIGYDKDYLHRGFYHFDEKVSTLSHCDKDIDSFITDAFAQMTTPLLLEVVTQTPGYLKLDKQKENAIWHMLKNENLPTKSLSNHEKTIKETVSAFKVKKATNKSIEFFKEIQKGFPHTSFLSTVEDSNKSKKEKLSVLLNIKQIYIKHFGELNPKLELHKSKLEGLEKIEKMTNNILKDIEVLEKKAFKEIKKEMENFIDESIKDKNISKDLIEQEINKFEFSSQIKEVLKEFILKRKETNIKKM